TTTRRRCDIVCVNQSAFLVGAGRWCNRLCRVGERRSNKTFLPQRHRDTDKAKKFSDLHVIAFFPRFGFGQPDTADLWMAIRDVGILSKSISFDNSARMSQSRVNG